MLFFELVLFCMSIKNPQTKLNQTICREKRIAITRWKHFWVKHVTFEQGDMKAAVT